VDPSPGLVKPMSSAVIKNIKKIFPKPLHPLLRSVLKLVRRVGGFPNDIELIRASSLFDEKWYLERNPDVRAAGVDALTHYIGHGAAEGRAPNPWFYSDRYFARNADGRAATVSIGEKDLAYERIIDSQVECRSETLKPIAFYLPQMHPIPENDRAWGKGFTEWTNVSKAVPQFAAHYQPKFPGELGFYDLRLPEVMYRQVELAKVYGLYAFCFHYYWFNGHRLLERPLDMFLADKSIDFRFCLCWANENWTRGWDGSEHEVIIAQRHSKDDHARVFEDLLRYIRDERYVRINGRPLIVVYRPDIIAELKALVAIWRRKATEAGLPGIYLVATNAFDFQRADQFGFDAICEFPPHGLPHTNFAKLPLLNFEFGGSVHMYEDVVAAELKKLESPPIGSILRFPGVMPAWDNEARRPGRGRVFHGSTPALFQAWLEGAAAHVSKHHASEYQFIFINAWNEWAEGAYLEPDRRFGYAYLAAVRNVVEKFNAISKQSLNSETKPIPAETGQQRKKGIPPPDLEIRSTQDTAATHGCPLRFERGMDFRTAATLQGYAPNVVDEIVRTAVQHFGDRRWTEPHESDSHFLHNLFEVRHALDCGNIHNRTSISTLEPSCDFLHLTNNYFNFTKALNLAVLAQIRPSQPCALVASVRNEGPFLLEWLAYQRSIGLENIYIYTNDNTDGSTELLEQLAEHGIIKLILNSCSENINPQIKAYEHSLFLLPELRQFQWVFYLDADEFFVPGADYEFDLRNVIAAINSRYGDNLPSCVCYNWHWIGSGGAVRRRPGFVTERFQVASPELNRCVKSLVRPRAVKAMSGLHAPSISREGFVVNSALEPVAIEQNAYVSPKPISSSSISGKINHYWQKSFEEFLVKQARAAASLPRSTDLFFRWDISDDYQMRTSLPGRLRHKLHSEHEMLLALPGIAVRNKHVDERFGLLCRELAGSEDVEALYSREKLQTHMLTEAEAT
jgi:hypothetical protein